MAESSMRNQQQVVDPKTRPLPVRLLTGVFGFYIFLQITAVFGILIEWVGIVLSLWDVPGSHHAAGLVEHELGYLQQFTTASRFGSVLQGESTQLISWAYQATWFYSPIGWATTAVEWLAKDNLTAALTYTEAARFTAQVIALRCVIATMTLPAFVVIGLVAIVDGLVQRDLRRFGGGNESSLIYHWAHRNVRPMLVLPWVIYLANPMTIHPSWVFIPCLAGFGIAVMVATSRFKKVL